MGLQKELSLVRGMRRSLTEDEQHKVADAIVASISSAAIGRSNEGRHAATRGRDVCNLYSITKGQQAIRQMGNAGQDRQSAHRCPAYFPTTWRR